MNIQERILTILKPLVASKGFSSQAVQGLATNLERGLTEESTDEDITSVINGTMPLFDIMQSENTRYVNEYKKKNPTTPAPNPANPDPNPTNPAPAPASTDKITELEKKIDLLLKQSNELSTKQKWDKLAEANGITNETLIKKWQPSNEDDFDSAMEELKEFNKDHVKQLANSRSPGKPNSADTTDVTTVTPKLSAKGKEALEGFKKANDRKAKKA